MTAAEKVAYLKGLAEGLGLDKDEKYGKVFTTLVDILEDLAYGLEEEQENSLNIGDELDALSEDLADVEDYLFGEDDCDCDCDCDDCDDWDDCDGDCDNCDFDCEEEYFEVECPSCGEVVCFDESIDPDSLVCPSCGEKFECLIEADEDEDEE